MLRIAERLAHWEGARVLVTGESLGQVASQTLENVTVIGRAVSMPVLRPLIAMDKEEVIADAQRIGTYDISILPDDDCCQLFSPRAPVTRATASAVDAAEESLPLAELIEVGVAGAIVEEFKFPMVQSATRL
jgi:thiamine biosynthesis protein ThiI